MCACLHTLNDRQQICHGWITLLQEQSRPEKQDILLRWFVQGRKCTFQQHASKAMRYFQKFYWLPTTDVSNCGSVILDLLLRAVRSKIIDQHTMLNAHLGTRVICSYQEGVHCRYELMILQQLLKRTHARDSIVSTQAIFIYNLVCGYMYTEAQQPIFKHVLIISSLRTLFHIFLQRI